MIIFSRIYDGFGNFHIRDVTDINSKEYDLTNIEIKEIKKRRIFRKPLVYNVIDTDKYQYLKLKKEEHFTYALHPFKLREF